MGLNQPQRDNVAKEAENRGYHSNSDGSKMINDKGDWLKFSENGQSVRTKDRKFNNDADAKKSRGW